MSTGTFPISIAPARLALGLLYACSFHYSSTYLKESYYRVYNLLKERDLQTFGWRYALLTIASILADLGDPNKYLDIHDEMKEEPLLYILLDQEIRNYTSESKIELKKTRQLSKKITTKLRRGRSAYEAFYIAPKTKKRESQAQQEVAAAKE